MGTSAKNFKSREQAYSSIGKNFHSRQTTNTFLARCPPMVADNARTHLRLSPVHLGEQRDAREGTLWTGYLPCTNRPLRLRSRDASGLVWRHADCLAPPASTHVARKHVFFRVPLACRVSAKPIAVSCFHNAP
ncbi:hypothetical protein BaRGS_00001998 [Batillaria attramentaria]|uniref:Uncharacterized protein n=1 Tax=Batillaria attramentaria TaxID=370345 RepID=A0ABD0M5T7_9CAEN